MQYKFCMTYCKCVSLLSLLESYPLCRYILGSGAPITNAVGTSGAISGIKRWSVTDGYRDGQAWRWK